MVNQRLPDLKNIEVFESVSNAGCSSFYVGNVKLTKRENQCVACLILGMTINQAAATLNISPRTVESYFGNIKWKLHCDNRHQIISKVLTNGFPIHSFLKSKEN